MARSESSAARFKALLVGNANYAANDPELSDLKGPLNDVDSLAARLADPRTGLFTCPPPLKNATAGEMNRVIGEFFSVADRNDCLLFYYSGHGRLDVSDRFYLCGADTDSRMHLHEARLSGDDLSMMVRYSPARLKIIILDCCYASKFKGGDWIRKHAFGEGSFVLAARRPDSDLVPDASTAYGLSPFTALLVEALESGELDQDADGFVTINEVAEYITTQARTRRDAPFAFQHWTGTGIVPIARSGLAAPDIQPAIVDPGSQEPPPGRHAALVPFSVAARPGALPELLPVPGMAARLGRHLVTNGQFRAFLQDPENAQWRPEAARAALLQVDDNYLRDWDGDVVPFEFEHYPVVNVSIRAALAYTTWVGRRLGEPLRLPRQAEWASAALAGRADSGWLAADVAAGRVNYRRTGAAPAPVGDFEPHPGGFCDLVGNVWDLCTDDDGLPVLRGGAFNTPEARLRERLQLRSDRECRGDSGFRCATDTLAAGGRADA
jgi:hypothetical protein